MRWADFHGILPAAATFSKDGRMWGWKEGEEATLLVEGQGGYVRDQEGRWFLDWVSGLGANLFGYHHPEWTREFRRLVGDTHDCFGFSLPHLYEWELGRMMAELCFPYIDGASSREDVMVRFGKTGSDALDMAVRLARAVTRRELVLSFGYHGWHDWYIAGQRPGWGVSKGGIMNLGSIEEITKVNRFLNPAAVVVEIPLEFDPASFEALREYCYAHDAFLILDEVVTGFRYGIPGYCERLESQADILCFAKGFGNGLPISCMVFPAALGSWFSRSDPVFISSTTFGDALSLAAGIATLKTMDRKKLEHIQMIGIELIRQLSEVSEEFPFFSVRGDPERSLIEFETDEQKGQFIYLMKKNGILMNRPNFPTPMHELRDVNRTAKLASQVLHEIEMNGDGSHKPVVLFRGR